MAASIRRMLDAGLTIEQALIAVEAVEVEQQPKRSTAAIRQERYRNRKRNSDVTTVTKRNSDACDAPPSSLPKRKVSPCTPSKENNPPSIPTSNPSDSQPEKRRASRVDEFKPSIEAAVEMGLPQDRAVLQSEKFIDYWRGRPGKDGTKLDWPATWRNWVRGEIERNGTGPSASNVRPFQANSTNANRPMTPMEAIEARRRAREATA